LHGLVAKGQDSLRFSVVRAATNHHFDARRTVAITAPINAHRNYVVFLIAEISASKEAAVHFTAIGG